MKPRSPDTEPWAEEKQIELLRQAGPGRRLKLAFQLSAFGWQAARSAFDRLFPHETEDERDLRFLTQIYGAGHAHEFIAFRQKVRGVRSGKINP